MRGIKFQTKVGNYSSTRPDKSYGAHSASYTVSPGPLSSGVQWPQHEADNEPQIRAKVLNARISVSASQHVFMAQCLSTDIDLHFKLLKLFSYRDK